MRIVSSSNLGMGRPMSENHAKALKTISHVKLPTTDHVFGQHSEL
jgi:hypothetical protein